jgi:predicted transcriptional regulator/transcriptional regulator with XRE-family HTH domain
MSLKNLGSKVRGQRRSRSLTQVELARRLGISPSYLNLIEHNQRPLTAELLIKLAKEFKLDFNDFVSETEERLAADLMELFADPIFDEHPLNSAEVRELAGQSPNLARGILALYRAYSTSRDNAQDLAGRMYDEQEVPGGSATVLPSEAINDFIQRRMNHFPEIEEAALSFVDEAKLEMGGRFAGMAKWLAAQGISVVVGRVGQEEGEMRRYDPVHKRVFLSDALAPHSRNFQLAAQLALIRNRDLLDHLSEDPNLGDEVARGLARVVLANYFAGAVLMPYEAFLSSAEAMRYDIELLGHRFGTGFEQVCHRLTSLRRRGREGIPFHMIRVDLAGNISKRFSASGIRFARFSGACPRWNVFSAFQTPGRIRVQISQMPGQEVFFCMARTVPKGSGGYHTPHTVQALGLGCQVQYARQMVYSDGVDLESLQGVQPVGVTCRLCERRDCDQRVLPNLRTQLRVDENVRRSSFFADGD